MKKKKLLFIIWSNSYGGGAEKQLTNLVNNLNKDKYEIDVIEFLHTNIKKEILAPHINELKPINNEESELKIKRDIINKLVYKCPSIVRKIYIKKKYDVEVSFNYLIPTFLLSNNHNSKKISWIHTHIWDIEDTKEPWLNALQRKSFNKSDKIVAIAEETKRSIVTLYPEYKDKTTIIYNGYDFRKLDELSKKFIVNKKNKFELLYSNRFDDNKNPLLLIEAANLLKEKMNEFHITFLGKGTLENEMKKLIKKYELENFIDIIGYVSNPYPYYKMSDIVCLTSVAEGFSTTLIEGLHFKKPFVSSSGGVTKEIIKENCGIVANTKEEYEDALYELMTNKELYKKLSENSFEISKKYSIETQVKNTEKLIDELVNK